MITSVHTEQENLPILTFTAQGSPIYPAKLHGHFFWNVPASGKCDEGCHCWDDIEEDDEPQRRKHKFKKIIYPACKYHIGHPENPHEPDSQAPLAIYHKGFAWIQRHEPTFFNCRTQSSCKSPDEFAPLIKSCMVFSPSTSTEYQA